MRRRPTAHDLPQPEPAGRRGLFEIWTINPALHKYLADRHADTVVLTFAEIEDLMGLALPARARLNTDSW